MSITKFIPKYMARHRGLTWGLKYNHAYTQYFWASPSSQIMFYIFKCLKIIYIHCILLRRNKNTLTLDIDDQHTI